MPELDRSKTILLELKTLNENREAYSKEEFRFLLLRIKDQLIDLI